MLGPGNLERITKNIFILRETCGHVWVTHSFSWGVADCLFTTLEHLCGPDQHSPLLSRSSLPQTKNNCNRWQNTKSKQSSKSPQSCLKALERTKEAMTRGKQNPFPAVSLLEVYAHFRVTILSKYSKPICTEKLLGHVSSHTILSDIPDRSKV